MRSIASITVWNNEAALFDTDHRFTIKLSPRIYGVEFSPLDIYGGGKSSLFVKSFEEIARFLKNSLDGELGTQANYHKTFQNAALYFDWRRNVSFTDRDIAWSVLIEFIGGKKEIYVSTNSAPLPVELDELEKMVKEALNIE